MRLWILALGPCLTYLGYLFIRNSYRKELFRLLTLVYILGLLSPVLTTFVAEHLGRQVFLHTSGLTRHILFSFAVIGVAEEGVKFFLLLPMCISKKYKKYEEVTADYMVSLAIAFSLGFATVENIIYVVFGEALTAVITGVYRMFFTVPAHIMFGALMGCGFAYAKFHESTGKRALYLSLAFFLPILMHGAFDFLIDLQKQASAYLMVVLVALLILRSCKKMKHLT